MNTNNKMTFTEEDKYTQQSKTQSPKSPKDCMFSFKITQPNFQKSHIATSAVQKKTSNNKITKNRKRLFVPVSSIISNMIYSPSIAADKIGISTSTLRRRFAEFDCGVGWPITELEWEEMNKDKTNSTKDKKSIQSIIHHQTDKSTGDPCHLDNLTMIVLHCAFKQHNLCAGC
ncbi:hypothetical protein AKO1_001847 [Acrasis kona]|uniref:RWP-RK domain-containing protein n=1 Tax=Acrasis kona TaxID=1008807 RepID=A0AAW2Z9P6_9EUKA